MPVSLEGGAATIGVQKRTKPATSIDEVPIPNPLEDPAWMLRHDRPTERVATRGLQHGAAAWQPQQQSINSSAASASSVVPKLAGSNSQGLPQPGYKNCIITPNKRLCESRALPRSREPRNLLIGLMPYELYGYKVQTSLPPYLPPAFPSMRCPTPSPSVRPSASPSSPLRS